jgi:hypothetical protein
MTIIMGATETSHWNELRVMMQEKVRPPEELVKEFFNLVEPQTSYRYAVLPYI